MVILAREQQGVKSRSGDFPGRERQAAAAPCAGRALKVRDSVKQYIRTETGQKVWYRIRRLKCRECVKLHRELKAFMLPYKHDEAECIEGTLECRLPDCCAESSTLN